MKITKQLLREMIRDELKEARAFNLSDLQDPKTMVGTKLVKNLPMDAIASTLGIWNRDQKGVFFDQLEDLMYDTVTLQIIELSEKVKKGE